MDLLDMGQTLGRGAYGKVFKGRLKLGPDLRVEASRKTYMKNGKPTKEELICGCCD